MITRKCFRYYVLGVALLCLAVLGAGNMWILSADFSLGTVIGLNMFLLCVPVLCICFFAFVGLEIRD